MLKTIIRPLWFRLCFRLCFSAVLMGAFPVGSAFAEVEDHYYVSENNTPFFTGPGMENQVIGLLGKNQSLIELSRDGEWVEVRDSLTKLVGWVHESELKVQAPENLEAMAEEQQAHFEAFEEFYDGVNERVGAALGQPPFLKIELISGGLARITADDTWLANKRHKMVAFNLHKMWKAASGGVPVILSFADKAGVEQFIVIDGPNRPRYLTPQKNVN